MAYIPDERFKGTLYDVEDCLDAITDEEVVKESEKKKAVKLFGMFLDFCMDEKIINGYDLAPLKFKLGLEVVVGPNGPTVMVNTTAAITDGHTDERG